AGQVTFVTCTTTDCCGRVYSTNFDVYPIRADFLSINCTDKYVGCSDTNWTFDPPTVIYDNCCPGNYTFYPQTPITNGTTCPMIITELWGVTDFCGNSNYCTQTIYVTNAPNTCCLTNAGRYQIVDLGALGGNASEAFAINNSGQIVGYSLTAGGASHAAYWENATSPPVDLGIVSGAYDSSVALGINDSNQIVGYSYHVVYPNFYSHASFWLNNSSPPWDIGTFAASGEHPPLNSAAYGINASGQIVGYAEGYSGFRFTGAAYWNSGYD